MLFALTCSRPPSLLPSEKRKASGRRSAAARPSNRPGAGPSAVTRSSADRADAMAAFTPARKEPPLAQARCDPTLGDLDATRLALARGLRGRAHHRLPSLGPVGWPLTACS